MGGKANRPIPEVNVFCKEDYESMAFREISAIDGIHLYDFQIRYSEAIFPKPVTLQWKIPAHNVKGMWQPTTDFNKRTHYDWEKRVMESRISIDAPVICLFGHDDNNVLTFACNDAISTVLFDACIREEDDHYHCHITFFMEPEMALTHYVAQLRMDTRSIHFSDSLKDVSSWWETFKNLKPIPVPDIAKQPVYSTWYQFHQNLNEDVLLAECKIASELGYNSIIIDDGWQTQDSNRGYDYTGDWQPDRIPKMGRFIAKIHDLDMKAALWYSVPFCGKKSEAYQKFKGKFLTEDHRWAPVFDPRYPEVREHLIGLYTSALRDWKLDGFKLDFIDDFHVYKDTPLGKKDGRDYGSINGAVDRLMTDVINELRAINPDVFVEFRQKYTGPAMRKYGNMFRAFDCPGDATMNRVRIADIKMLCGETAVHSDMVTWHFEERVEVAALQLMNTLFGVPQLSVLLKDTPPDHLEMIRFYTNYWNQNRDVLMNGLFVPSKPLANYPTQRVVYDDHTIIGVYDEFVIPIENITSNIHFLNVKLTNEVVVKCAENFGDFTGIVYDCLGNIFSEITVALSKGITAIEIPPGGMIALKELP